MGKGKGAAAGRAATGARMEPIEPEEGPGGNLRPVRRLVAISSRWPMKTAIGRRRSRAPMEISPGTFSVVVCATLALLCITARSAAAD